MLLHWLRQRRRAKVRARPFPEAWRAALEKNVPQAARLSGLDRTALEGLVQVFLAEKRFEGCAGQEITDEVRVTIAAQACLLLLRRPDGACFPEVTSILVYPWAWQAPSEQRLPDGTVIAGTSPRLGEAWRGGEVVLAWDAVLSGASDLKDGRNLVLHEFAHKLDMEDGPADGAPALGARTRYLAWARVLSREFLELQARAGRGKRSVLDAYGATSPAEFFAVATETFFEKPGQLKQKRPELYAQLAEYYRQDPAG